MGKIFVGVAIHPPKVMDTFTNESRVIHNLERTVPLSAIGPGMFVFVYFLYQSRKTSRSYIRWGDSAYSSTAIFNLYTHAHDNHHTTL